MSAVAGNVSGNESAASNPYGLCPSSPSKIGTIPDNSHPKEERLFARELISPFLVNPIETLTNLETNGARIDITLQS
jgi:hypothetical protein